MVESVVDICFTHASPRKDAELSRTRSACEYRLPTMRHASQQASQQASQCLQKKDLWQSLRNLENISLSHQSMYCLYRVRRQGRIEARQRPNDTPTPGHAQNIPQCINPPRDGTSTVRRGADHRADSLRQGGASILGIETGNKSFAVNGSQRYRGGLTAGAYPDEAAGFAKAGGLPVRAGVATVNSSSASGPLRLTCSRSATEVAVAVEKNGASEWQEFWDDEVEASYYFNCTTREAQWVRPDGL